MAESTSTDGLARATVVMERCEALGALSDEPDRLTRAYGTPALREAHELTAGWMRAAGMQVRRDAVRNLIGRYGGTDDAAGTLLLGSHLDTVRDAGKYDGPLGVLVGLAVVEGLQARQQRLPFAVEVIVFADEEGLRYSTSYMGSSVMAGSLDPGWLAVRDADGVTMGDAIKGFDGDPEALPDASRRGKRLLGYAELHIEQGPVLESRDLPVGVVTAIAGRNRIGVDFTGEAGHAGTVAMDLRRDALCAAAEFVLAVEATGRATPGLVATVGQISAEPGAANVVPGRASLSIDLRHPDDETRGAARQSLESEARAVAAKRGVAVDWTIVTNAAALTLDAALTDRLAAAVASTGHPVHRLPSGAGHDAVPMSEIAPAAMLFARCRGGVSHNPAESVTVEDVAVAIAVLDQFVAMFGSTS